MAVVGPIYSLKHHLRAAWHRYLCLFTFMLCFDLWWPLLHFPLIIPGGGLKFGDVDLHYTPSFNAYLTGLAVLFFFGFSYCP